jgi:diaminopimelate epimerase
MNVKFVKYQGAGNDFILIDNRNFQVKELKTETIKFLCDRHFGIGADGLMLLNTHKKYDFEMDYYNSDGSGSTMCGNGGRCIIRFAHDLKIIGTETTFVAIDGPHKGKVLGDVISLQMQDVSTIDENETRTELDTGSPHYVAFMDEIPDEEFVQEARAIRQNAPYTQEGINVNFATAKDNKITMRTFERGVEDETLACGTGATAVAIAAHKKGLVTVNSIPLKVMGGDLNVNFEATQNGYANIWLTGPAEFVFEGKLEA